jgi:hypothetical protein
MTTMKRSGLLILLFTGLAPLAFALLLTGCGGGGGGSTAENEGVYSPGSRPFGRTYGEWSAAWWQWVYLFSIADDPINDPTGEKAPLKQKGPVWFLAGTRGTTTERTVTVPSGKALFFPIVNICGWTTSEPGPESEAEMKEIRPGVKDAVDHATELEVIMDGVALQGLRNYRSQSPPSFLFTSPADGPPERVGTHEAFSDGYWIMLEPLSPGQHTLYFRGKFVFPGVDGGEEYVFETAVTYNLTIQ